MPRGSARMKLPLLALKRPTVLPTESLLTGAVLKHERIIPNRRP
jgi:hypothetical protein